MPTNQVQFQAGLSLREFQRRFGTETQCREALFNRRFDLATLMPRLLLTLSQWPPLSRLNGSGCEGGFEKRPQQSG